MGISDIHVFSITITCLLQGTLCDTGIPCTFYGENICSVELTWKYCCEEESVKFCYKMWIFSRFLTYKKAFNPIVILHCAERRHLWSRTVHFSKSLGISISKLSHSIPLLMYNSDGLMRSIKISTLFKF